MVFLTYLGFTTGDVHKLTAPVALFTTDDGVERYELCGYKNETDGYAYNNLDYPNLVITVYSMEVKTMFDSAVCVKECPTEANGYAIEC
jgi:hypothetical protein